MVTTHNKSFNSQEAYNNFKPLGVCYSFKMHEYKIEIHFREMSMFIHFNILIIDRSGKQRAARTQI